MIGICLTCGGAILQPNKPYMYAGPVCLCLVPTKIQKPTNQELNLQYDLIQKDKEYFNLEDKYNTALKMWETHKKNYQRAELKISILKDALREYMSQADEWNDNGTFNLKENAEEALKQCEELTK